MSDILAAEKKLRFLAISGSLRGASSNTILLRVVASVAPAPIEVRLYEGLGELPHFNPDLDGEAALPAVADFRARLQESDAVLICSPEYAHGVPGVLKNALDWIVGSGELMGKPLALLNAKPSATFAQASLTETLTVMMAEIDPDASIALSLGTNKVDETALIANEELTAKLRTALLALAKAVQKKQLP